MHTTISVTPLNINTNNVILCKFYSANFQNRKKNGRNVRGVETNTHPPFTLSSRSVMVFLTTLKAPWEILRD